MEETEGKRKKALRWAVSKPLQRFRVQSLRFFGNELLFPCLEPLNMLLTVMSVQLLV